MNTPYKKMPSQIGYKKNYQLANIIKLAITKIFKNAPRGGEDSS